MSVSVCGQHLKNSVVNSEDADIEGSTSQVKHQNVLLSSFLVESISDGCRGRLVDDSSHIETGNDTSILSGLSLGVIEVSCRDKGWQISRQTLPAKGLCRISAKGLVAYPEL